MSDGDEEFEAVVVSGRRFHVICGTLAELILDYRKYDPEFANDPSAHSFRGGVLTATSDNASTFLRALRARELSMAEAAAMAETDASDRELLALIDFDSKLYIHAYYDLPLENYVPDGWRGVLGDPREALGRQIHNLGRTRR